MTEPITEIGTALQYGGQTTAFASYIVESQTDNEAETAKEDIDNADGSLSTRAIYKRLPKISFTLICKAGAVPATDFPVENKCAATGTYLSWYVDSAAITRTKSPTKLSVTLTSLGI